MLKEYGDLNSKFKFVILASKRAKDLLKGAKPKIKSKSKNLIRIAQQEISRGLIDYELIQAKPEDHYEEEEEMFTAEDKKEDKEESSETSLEEEQEGKEVAGEEENIKEPDDIKKKD